MVSGLFGRKLIKEEASCEGKNKEEAFREEENEIAAVFADHKLTNFREGHSEVEQLARKIEERRDNRIKVTLDVRKMFVIRCRSIAEEKEYPIWKIRLEDLKAYLSQVEQHGQENNDSTTATTLSRVGRCVMKLFGMKDPHEQLVAVLKEAVNHVEENDEKWFHYMDFNAFFTVLEPTLPWLRSDMTASFTCLLAFYIFTPIFFCLIARDDGVCQANESTGDLGWMSALYFASTTLSTVGYGDLSVSKDHWYQLWFGILYMILANVTLIVAFTSAAESTTALKRLEEWDARLLNCAVGEDSTEVLFKKIHRLRIFRLGEIIVTFILLNMLGVFAVQIAIYFGADEEDEQLTWWESVYWAVQTTTTIGYGDLSTPFHLRWFQIFYLIISTFFIGRSLGGLASLREELETTRRDTAWKRRQVTKSMIDELQPYQHDENVDQYEFVVASLVTLKKISSDDVIPIMNKYRELANREVGFIRVKEAREEADEVEEMIATMVIEEEEVMENMFESDHPTVVEEQPAPV